MRKKLFFAAFSTFLLIGALGATTYVALQNQENRGRAANDVEFMQVTQAQRRKDKKTQVSVVLNKLDPKFRYRLKFDLKYEGDPTAGTQKPDDRKKTREVKENKTYKYTFTTPPCGVNAKLDIQLYFRDKQTSWKPVDAPTATGNTKLEIPCPTTVVPTPTSEPESTESATIEPTVEPTIAPPESEESLPPADETAEPIEDLENEDVLKESPEPSPSSTPTPTPNPSPTINSEPSPSPIVINSPTLPSPIPTPTALAEAVSNPTPSPANTVGQVNNQTTETGGFGAILTTNPTPANTTEVYNPSPTLIAVTIQSPPMILVSSPSPTAITSPIANPSPFKLVPPKNPESPLGIILTGIGSTILVIFGVILLL